MGVWEISTTFLPNKRGGGFVGMVGLERWKQRLCVFGGEGMFSNQGTVCSRRFCETDWDEDTTLGTFPWEKQRGREGQREYLGLSNIYNRLSLFIPASK